MGKHNWKEMAERCVEAIGKDGPFTSKQAVADFLDMPVSTVKDALRKDRLPKTIIGANPVKEENFPSDKPDVIYNTNDAEAKFEAAERLTAEEVAELAGIDLNVWVPATILANAYTTQGRKITKSILWDEHGISEGSFVEDEGTQKVYMWQMKVTFVRRKPIAVEPVLQFIKMPEIKPAVLGKPKNIYGGESILMWTDSHFGFRGELCVHSRRFIGALIALAKMYNPYRIIHLGDILDLPDWSTFVGYPETLRHTQRAAIEAAYVFGLMRPECEVFDAHEGNHDMRVRRELAKHVSEAYDLKPVTDLGGYSLLSVPRLLGFEEMDINWYGDYERKVGQKVGRCKFHHGDKANGGIAKTVGNIGNRTVHTYFFGHIHDYELGVGWNEWSGEEYYIACPGGACTKLAPGAKEDSHWTIGAFLIHLDEEGVPANVEHIREMPNGRVIFRDQIIEPYDYVPGLNEAFNGMGYYF